MEVRVGNLLSDRYVLVEHISKSSMSTVFKAWDQEQKRLVVIKVATNNRNSSKLVKFLKREERALKRLNHPHIVRLLDSGHFGESHFVVLEYIDGKDLETLLESDFNPLLPISESVSIIIKVLEGLEAMHQEFLVHRDIKPGNLMISSAGVKILDLGLVKSVSKADQNQKRSIGPKTAVGTLPYMSPEQLRDEDRLDGRADLFACGVVLYKLLTGTLPFYLSHRDDFFYWKRPPLPFQEANSLVRIPDNIKQVVWKALQIDPNLRYQTAKEMRMALLAARPMGFKMKINRFFGKVAKSIWPW